MSGVHGCLGSYAWVLAVVVVVSAAGCKDHREGLAAGGEAPARSPATKVSTATSVSASGASALPLPVGQAEALAEDVQTDLTQNAWPAAEARLRELRSLGEKLVSVGVPQAKQSAYGQAVDSLGGAIMRRNPTEALTAGNHVSRIVTGIMAGYPTKIPVEVAYMDVAGRDVLYAAQLGRWSGAADHVMEVGRRYAAVQAHVRASNPALDQRVTSEIAQLQRAVVSRERDRAATLAQSLLEDVDLIEQTF